MTAPHSGKSKIVLIARNFPPLVGGIENMMAQVLRSLSQRFDVILIGPAGCSRHASGAKMVYELPAGPVSFLACGFFLATWITLKYRPALALASNGVMAPLLWWVSKLHNVPTIIFLHGLDIVTTHPFYRALIWPLACRADLLSVNSENSRQLAIRLGAQPERIRLIFPCIRLPIAFGKDQTDLKRSLENYGSFILYAGRIVPRKGLFEFIQHAHPWLHATGTHLVVAGAEPFGQADRTASNYLESTKELVDALGLHEQVHWLGRVNDQEMALCMSAATVHVMPLVPVEGDVEGFGMVAVEAASYGTPTVAFNCGGVADALSAAEYLVPSGDYPSLIETVEKQLLHTPDSATLRLWAAKFYPVVFQKNLLAIVSELIGDH